MCARCQSSRGLTSVGKYVDPERLPATLFSLSRISGRRVDQRKAQILVETEADSEEHLEFLRPEGMKEHFQIEGDGAFRRHGNTIGTAAYFATSENEDYCSGGFRN